MKKFSQVIRGVFALCLLTVVFLGSPMAYAAQRSMVFPPGQEPKSSEEKVAKVVEYTVLTMSKLASLSEEEGKLAEAQMEVFELAVAVNAERYLDAMDELVAYAWKAEEFCRQGGTPAQVASFHEDCNNMTPAQKKAFEAQREIYRMARKIDPSKPKELVEKIYYPLRDIRILSIEVQELFSPEEQELFAAAMSNLGL